MIAARPPERVRENIVQRRKVKRMTVAAGFDCDKGLVFCADTKITAAAKTEASKISFETYANGECATVFTISASDMNFAATAVRDCQEAVSKMSLAKADIPAIRKAIESALAKYYKTHIFGHPDRKEIGFFLLVGIWLRGEKVLYSSDDTVLRWVDQYECIGGGGYLARYLIRQFLRSHDPRDHFTLDDAALIGSYAARVTMEYDESCGGQDVEMLILKDDGSIENSLHSLLYPNQTLIEGTQQAMWKMFRGVARLGPVDMDTESSILMDDFFAEVRKLNKDSAYWFDLRKKLAEGKF
jgi:20S proteasome alpha/beta subunit